VRETTRLNEQLRDELARRIVAGQLEPGAALPSEKQLAEQMRVSKGVVREVMRGLEERGMVSVRHGLGAVVNDPDDWDHADPVVIAARLAGPERDVVLDEAIELDLTLETQAARQGAGRAEPGRIEAMAQALAASEAAAGQASDEPASAAYHDADLAFHHAILQAAGNRTLAAVDRRLQRVLIAEARRRGPTPADVERELAEHRRILAAYVAKDPDAAAAAVQEHLTGWAERLRARSPRA
jgi:GntR family transcriptional repressor for pyruvate dehydrogenase complex